MAKFKAKEIVSVKTTRVYDVPKKGDINSVKSIYVKNLFGHYTYKLPKEENQDLSRLFILYGDNGSGKTTILKTVFNLISTKDGEGFKTKIAKTIFERFSIEFDNGLTIGAERKDAIIGGFNLFIKLNNRSVHEVELKQDEDGDIRLAPGSIEDRKYATFLSILNKLKISVFYLSDNRKLFHSFRGELGTRLSDDEESVFINERVNRLLGRRKGEQEKVELESAADRFVAWVRDKVIAGSKTGDTTAVGIYTDVIKNINKIETSNAESSKLELLETIRELSQKSIHYAKFGLIDNYEYQDIIDVFSKVRKSDKIELIYKITKPFFDSLKARLEALEGLQRLLENFINSINEYYSRKTFEFNLLTGFKIIHEKGDKLSFNDLSSGEKQLFLLFINTITASDEATVFIIDEPEISLNIKWQRRLLKTLLEFSKNGKVQFIIATHSIELLASNLNNVVKIEE